MSLVAIPFKNESPDTVLRIVEISAAHPRVKTVLAVGAEEDETFRALHSRREELQRENGTTLEIVLQERIGSKRPGKGDAMNTALHWFLKDTQLNRIHFYDADITSFTTDWITHAEDAADLGFDVVRHYFPRTSTDGMVTFLVTRTGFALLWPTSELPWIEQPLGGELLFSRAVVEKLVDNQLVQAQSDWGIDTVYTFFNVRDGFSMYETYRPEGKAHTLYGKLADLRTMLVECFAVVQALSRSPLNDGWAGADPRVLGGIVHRVEPPFQVPLPIIENVGFDIQGTVGLLLEGWTHRQEELLNNFPRPIRDGLLVNRERPNFQFMGEDEWCQTYLSLLQHWEVGDADWEDLLFKLWTARVLNYSVNVALRGYGFARRYRHATIVRYLKLAHRRALPTVGD
jgi:mannosylglycerate synthase